MVVRCSHGTKEKKHIKNLLPSPSSSLISFNLKPLPTNPHIIPTSFNHATTSSNTQQRFKLDRVPRADITDKQKANTPHRTWVRVRERPQTQPGRSQWKGGRLFFPIYIGCEKKKTKKGEINVFAFFTRHRRGPDNQPPSLFDGGQMKRAHHHLPR